MVQILIINVKRNLTGYIELTYKMSFILPVIYGIGTVPIKGLSVILASFPDGFSSEIIPVTGTVIILTDTISAPSTITLAQVKAQLISKYTAVRTKLDSLTLTPYDTIAGLSYDGTVWT